MQPKKIPGNWFISRRHQASWRSINRKWVRRETNMFFFDCCFSALFAVRCFNCNTHTHAERDGRMMAIKSCGDFEVGQRWSWSSNISDRNGSHRFRPQCNFHANCVFTFYPTIGPFHRFRANALHFSPTNCYIGRHPNTSTAITHNSRSNRLSVVSKQPTKSIHLLILHRNTQLHLLLYWSLSMPIRVSQVAISVVDWFFKFSIVSGDSISTQSHCRSRLNRKRTQWSAEWRPIEGAKLPIINQIELQ